jgi:hypothetical protein
MGVMEFVLQATLRWATSVLRPWNSARIIIMNIWCRQVKMIQRPRQSWGSADVALIVGVRRLHNNGYSFTSWQHSRVFADMLLREEHLKHAGCQTIFVCTLDIPLFCWIRPVIVDHRKYVEDGRSRAAANKLHVYKSVMLVSNATNARCKRICLISFLTSWCRHNATVYGYVAYWNSMLACLVQFLNGYTQWMEQVLLRMLTSM